MIEVDETNAGVVAKEVKRIQAEFAVPFADAEIKLKPAMVKNNRALALHYIDSRAVMDRLDAVVGVAGWKDEYTVLPSGEVECRLSVRFGTQWVTKADVGGQSEQPDEGDRMKAAYSDALKRAAVKFGIGRHLYRIPQQWMDYDPVKKQIVRPQPPKQAQERATPSAPGEPKKPVADNPRRRAEIAQKLAQCNNRADYLGVCDLIVSDMRAGVMSDADREALRGIAAEVAAKFPPPAKS